MSTGENSFISSPYLGGNTNNINFHPQLPVCGACRKSGVSGVVFRRNMLEEKLLELVC